MSSRAQSANVLFQKLEEAFTEVMGVEELSMEEIEITELPTPMDEIAVEYLDLEEIVL